ncbi:SDR family oxidoreductase [Litorilituus lipolyticus]|uniref:SDR family oxidoreductase n=1 Tax=Litorilituus lipolyticus TaxID=2491017 RepID=A0A502KYM2_9GAMM|nr:SDR family oxidoreductase [Litorilituus lipolyticus]TPH15051.1 SDR family oxidoreductase [Litorilituus lipolyticus]
MSKTLVITGANRGIGFAMAKLAHSQGHTVFALCRHASAQLNNLGVRVIENIDVATSEGLNEAKAALTDVQIDLLINNAGILRDESLQDLNTSTIREQFEVNALAPLSLTHALLNNLPHGSKVALITSRMGSIADNTSGGRYGYRMSKAALNIAGMSLAQDLKSHGISVGIYHPGYVQTDMVNHGGDISSDEAATRLLGLMDKLTLAESGVFKHSNGETLPW